MMFRRAPRALPIAFLAALDAGDVGAAAEGVTPGTPAAGAAWSFVGFDASEPLVECARGKESSRGSWSRIPSRWASSGVKTLVEHLEKKPVEPKISTGETLVTPENMDRAADRDAAPAAQGGELGGRGSHRREDEEVAGDGDPQGDDARVLEDDPRRALKAAEELGNVEVIWQGPQKEDERTQQIQLVQSAVAAGWTGSSWPRSTPRRWSSRSKQAIAKGIPVVIIDSGLESTKIVSYVATDNYHGGVLAARRLGEVLKGEGKIILLRYAVGSASTEQREKGFTDTIAKEFPKITYLSDTEYAGATSDTAQQKAQSLVTRYPRPGRRGLLPERVEHARACSGPWRGRGCWRSEP